MSIIWDFGKYEKICQKDTNSLYFSQLDLNFDQDWKS